MADLSTISVTIGADVLDTLIEMAVPKRYEHRIVLEMAVNARSEAVINAEADEAEAQRINESLHPEPRELSYDAQ